MYLSTRLLLAAALSVAPAVAQAAEPAVVPAPQMRAGDSWVFDRTIERGTAGFGRGRKAMKVESVDGDTMIVGVKPDGSPMNFQDVLMGTDWSKRRNIEGKDVVTARPFAFPLSVGKTWSADYADTTPHGNTLSAKFHVDYHVAGWEDVTTPAGAFHALKIEAVTHVDAHLAASTSAAMAGTGSAGGGTSAAQVTNLPDRMVHETWREQLFYVPELKYYAKFVGEHYNAEELSSYKLQP
jgi:hypothetical protein